MRTEQLYTPDISWLSDGRRDGRLSYCTLQGRQMIDDTTSHPSCRELSDRDVDGFWCEQIYMTTKKKKKTKKQENKLNEKYEYIFWTFVHYTVYLLFSHEISDRVVERVCVKKISITTKKKKGKKIKMVDVWKEKTKEKS